MATKNNDMIAEALVNQIKQAANILEVVGEFVSLKRTGPNYKGLCPFHGEVTPSFTVSPAKGIYKCFGCGKGGDAVSFVMEHERISYPMALKVVAKKYNIDVPERELTAEEAAAYKRRENALAEQARMATAFKEALPNNQEALNWLMVDRGITKESIKKWGLGWAGNGFFGGRIMYPICNSAGEAVGFTGRILPPHNPPAEAGGYSPKFKNSAEGEVFKKGEVLYGFHLAKMKIQRMDRCYIVEGQHDVIMMHQLGYENTVAGSGTSLTVKQIAMIKPWTKNIVLFLDGDKAGTAAAIKHISTLLGEQVNIRIIALPEREDPDSYIRKTDPDKARMFINNGEIDFIEFKVSKVFNVVNKDDPTAEAAGNSVAKGELITEIANDISLIHDKNVRLVYIQRCAELMGIKEAELGKDIAKLREKMKSKSEEGVFFAFEEAKTAIKDTNEAYLMANYEDVIDYHLNGNSNYIGMNGATLQKPEILKLKKLTKTVIFEEILTKAFTEKPLEETATVKNLKRLISYGVDVRMKVDESEDMVDEDTGEIKNAGVEYLNFTDWYIDRVALGISVSDDRFTSFAIEHTAELLSYLPESTRMVKINNMTTAFKDRGVKLIIGDFKKILANYLKKNAKSFEPDAESIDPNGADNPRNLKQDQLNDLNRYQHYFEKNAIHHVSITGSIQKISNFVIIPIIHSNTSTGHFKLFEMTNEYGLKVNISLDTKDLNDLRRFKCAVEEKGNFVFKGNQGQLDNIKERLYSNTTYSNEIEQLGWQTEGFWAWADGVTTLDGKFTKTDSNGLIAVGEKNFLIKPFSNLYANDKTAYLNEKKFTHKTSDTTFEDWSRRYVDVFGDNAMICICALLTGIYSDAIFKIVHGELPLINFFGPKGTGKTQQADSILAFFGEKQPINNLSKVTIYGLSQTLKSFHNAFCLIDEYKNSLDMRFIEMLKSIYNRQGKIQGNFSQQGTKTEHIPINQMVLLCGQDLPTLDVALLERCLCLTAYKSDYTDEQKKRYNELKDMEEKGFAHLTDEFLKYRGLVIEQFPETISRIQTEVSERCKEVSVRLQKNLTIILATFAILENKFQFPFSYERVFGFGMRVITEQQKFIESSDDLKNFWSIVATLIEQDRIKEGRNYVLHDVMEIKYLGNDNVTRYGKGMMILFLRWDGLFPLYAEYSRRSNMVALSEKTIQFYLEKTKYYQGKLKSKKFADKKTGQTWVNQAYCFDYDAMNINLIETKTADIEVGNTDMTPKLEAAELEAIEVNNKYKDPQENLPF